MVNKNPLTRIYIYIPSIRGVSFCTLKSVPDRSPDPANYPQKPKPRPPSRTTLIMTTLLKRRTVILTGATAAITAVGAYTGALLKTDADTRAGLDKRREEDLETRIERWANLSIYYFSLLIFHGRLKYYRDGLERKKIEMEAKILGLHEQKEHRS